MSNGQNWGRLYAITRDTESRNRDYDDKGRVLRSPVGAMGRMQVMPATARDPGFGIRPWNGRDMDDLARVGEQLLQAMVRRYNGDLSKAWAAYNWGPGNVDRAVRNHGSNWLRNAPEETRNYVRRNMGLLGRDVNLPEFAGGPPANNPSNQRSLLSDPEFWKSGTQSNPAPPTANRSLLGQRDFWEGKITAESSTASRAVASTSQPSRSSLLSNPDFWSGQLSQDSSGE